MSRPLIQLRALFKFWLALFAFGALLFFFFPETLLRQLNSSSQWLPFLRPGETGGTSFWLALTTSLMVTLTVLAYFIVEDISNAQNLVLTVLISKTISTLAFLYFYFKKGYEAPMFWGALCDGSIFGITFIFFKRAYSKAPAS